MFLDIIKHAGFNTPHQFAHHRVSVSLPSKDGKEPTRTVVPNEWYDLLGIKYIYLKNNCVLKIYANDFFPDSIVDYINNIPNDFHITINFVIFSGCNEVAGFNMLCDALSRIRTSKLIIINVSDMRFGQCVDLAIDRLPDNVRISNVINHDGVEDTFYGENSLDWWGLNLSDEQFTMFVSKLTPLAAKRASELRNIAYNTYLFFKKYDIDNLTIKEKSALVYKWCKGRIGNGIGYIEYDINATYSDGTFNFDCRYSQDPIETYKRKKGVCAGRARLFKVMLNNCYMHVPCFLVSGMAGRLQHEWNEVIDENGNSTFFDMSEQGNLSNIDHRDFEASRSFLDYENSKVAHLMPKPYDVNE